MDTFDAIQSDLRQGINLIEASAGTGKTYTIAMLVLRFLVEKAIRIEELLIVTFTNAATEELKERVRARLSEARRALSGYTEGISPDLIAWAKHLDIDKALACSRLELALLNIDQAGILTIHGFCLRVLKEHALESAQLFDSELTGDIGVVRQQIADDFWRQQVYARTPSETAVLTSQYATPDQLLASIENAGAKTKVYPPAEELEKVLEAFRNVREQARDQLDDLCCAVASAFSEGLFKTDYMSNFDPNRQAIGDWLNGQTPIMPSQECLSALTEDGLKKGLNGSKLRKTKTQTGDERKQAYIDALGLKPEPFNALVEAMTKVTLAFRRALVEYLRTTMGQRLQQLNVLSFDDLITRLADALNDESAEFLKTELRQCYKIALIDEFQDTDQAQWHIFATLFGSDQHFLYLIGDPKQAIYKFRGADIFSYFSALKQARYHFTLKKNWRSHPLLVQACNTLFRGETKNPFLLDQLQYIEVKPALSNEQGALKQSGKASAPMVLWQLGKNPEHDSGYWKAPQAGVEIQSAVIMEILELLHTSRGAEIVRGNQSKHLRPGDIAILVRSNKQAREYQDALRIVGIPSVLNSTESVFASDEAVDLLILMRAVANPGDLNSVKQALTLSWFKLDGQGFYQTISDENALDLWVSRFQDYYQLWNGVGLMAMMHHLLAQEKIRQNISEMDRAERRLTNLHHLIELVQQNAVDLRLGIHKTIEWLGMAISDQSISTDERQLRLESDADAVKIVTMHRSKGLEFAVVFCPYLWQRSARLKSERHLIRCHENGEIVIDLGSKDFETRRNQALREELAEDLRLMYVALTRAQLRCYLVWADVRPKNAPNSSAMAYLLHAASAENWREELMGVDFSQQCANLQAIRQKAPNAFEYRLLNAPIEKSGSYRLQTETPQFAARRRKRGLTTNLQMSSYTALSSLSLKDAPELPLDKAQEQQARDTSEKSEQRLPKGAHTGNVVHEILEKVNFRAIADGDDFSVIRDAACQRHGLILSEPDIIDSLLKQVVQTPLSADNPDFCLANLDEGHCLKEMPFYLAMAAMDTAKVNKILNASIAFEPLHAKQMEGYLTGFIDLICEHQGRYYVMDYKTNGLADYKIETLIRAMREHNYGLQYWIYTLVLHQYLKNRLQNYQYETHFGGVRYLFVRGMEPARAMSGVYEDRPDLRDLEALSRVFGISV